MNFIEPILFIGISQSFFAGMLLATRRPYTLPERLITAWVFLYCAELIFALINLKVQQVYSFPFIAFTYGPVLFLYVRHMTIPDLKFSTLNFLHFIPFAVFFVVSVVFRERAIVSDLSNFLVIDRFLSLRIIYSACFFLSVSFYSISSFVLIRNHQARLRDMLSYTSARITLNWLKILSVTFYGGYLVVFIMGGVDIISDVFPFDPYIIVYIFITLFSFVYSFYAVRQPGLFDSVSWAMQAKTDPQPGQGERYARSGLHDDQARDYLNRLLDYMNEEKPYLNGELTINDLAQRTGIPRHYITEVLNENYGRNFFTFINEYRVREVISRMNDPKYQHYTVLALAFDSGFNSKSTFNTIFKAYTGKTPSEYRTEAASL